MMCLRAISLMIVNTMREFSRPEDFLGHIEPQIYPCCAARPTLLH
jgi:hypothetical protein